MKDIDNTYVTFSDKENSWTVLVPEFVEDNGKVSIIARALYVVKSLDALFQNHLYCLIKHIGYMTFQYYPY